MERVGVSPWKVIESPEMSLSNSKIRRTISTESTDRFIPRQLNFDSFCMETENKWQPKECPEVTTPDSNLNESLRQKSNVEVYKKLLKKHLGDENEGKKLLKYGQGMRMKGDFVLGEWKQPGIEVQNVRKISKQPYKILDAPRLKDDFYNNLLDWNKDDLIAITLGNVAYVWSGKSNQADKIADGSISCVKWGPKILALGDQFGIVRTYDVQKRRVIRRYANHLGRVGAIDFNHNVMATGSKDQRIILTDLRSDSGICKFYGHRQEICGLKFSFDDNYLASGGNDNAVFLWSPKMNKQIIRFNKHTAAVKGLAWSPHKHSLLVSGGGASDKSIKLWNAQQLKLIDSIDTGSQVCNMVFSQNTNELLTTHGFSLNTITVWRQRDMKRIATLHGHTYRVLYLAVSPDGQSVVTGSGDETLRFWKVFPSRKECTPLANSNLDLHSYQIR